MMLLTNKKSVFFLAESFLLLACFIFKSIFKSGKIHFIYWEHMILLWMTCNLILFYFILFTSGLNNQVKQDILEVTFWTRSFTHSSSLKLHVWHQTVARELQQFKPCPKLSFQSWKLMWVTPVIIFSPIHIYTVMFCFHGKQWQQVCGLAEIQLCKTPLICTTAALCNKC